MANFEASLAREKITLFDVQDPAAVPGPEAELTVIRSNRIVLHLTDGVIEEQVVVRAQSMSSTLRFAAKILFSYFKSGLFMRRAAPFEWEENWRSILTTHDERFSPELWSAVYVNGKVVFQTGRFPFVDVIEQVAAGEVAEDYDAAIGRARMALQRQGKPYEIEHLNKTAAVFTDTDHDQLRCGIIQRAGGKDTTFSFSIHGGEQYSRVIQALNAAAALLEAINIRHFMRYVQLGLHHGTIYKGSHETLKYHACADRLVELRKMMTAFEEHFDVRYRPEKPDVFAPPRDLY